MPTAGALKRPLASSKAGAFASNGVLYRLPWQLSDRLDQREGVANGDYRPEFIAVEDRDQYYRKQRFEFDTIPHSAKNY